jgi:drug/metabolite transporter (DMT)-like permease
MKPNKVQLAILALIITNIIWGATSPIFKWTLQDVQPFTFAFLRFAISSIILLPLTYKHLKIKKGDVPLLIILSIFGLTFHIAYNLLGLTLAPSINAIIIGSSAPVFLIIGAIMLFHEKTKRKVINGTLLSFFGVMIIVFNPILSKQLTSTLIGNIFLMVSMALGVAYTLLLKELAPKYKALTLMFWTFSIASLTFFPFACFEMIHNSMDGILKSKGILGLVFTIIFPTIIAYGLNLYGVRYIKASEVGIFSYVDPFVGIAVAIPLLGEHMNSSFLLGAFLVFLGIFIAEGRIHYHPIHLLRQKSQLEQADDKPPHETASLSN